MAEATAVLSQEEKTACLLHMGYQAQQLAAASITLGIPAATQPQFLVAMALERIPESSVGRFRVILARLDRIEQRMMEIVEQMDADRVDQIVLNKSATGDLEAEYNRWAQRLSNLLGAPLNPYAERYATTAGVGRSRPVLHA